MKTIRIIFSLGVLFLMSCQSNSSSGENNPAAQAAATAAPIGADIMHKHWKLVEINGQPVTNPPANQKEAYIMLMDSNKLAGNTGCNEMSGRYEISEGNRIRFFGIGTTMMACQDVAIEQELGRNLHLMDNYSINGTQMTLQKAKMAPMFRFEAIEK